MLLSCLFLSFFLFFSSELTVYIQIVFKENSIIDNTQKVERIHKLLQEKVKETNIQIEVKFRRLQDKLKMLVK